MISTGRAVPDHVLGVPIHRWLVGVAVLPFLASAVALVVGVGGSYAPVSDAALAEMLVRDVGHHPVLLGLYSRDDWSHPGPLLYYLLAPFYWATGGSSIGLNLGALAINGGSVIGMGLIARRRAGNAAMLASFLGSALMMRTLGAEFLHSEWNPFVTTLPFGLLVFLVWSMLAGDRGASPIAVFVASYLAQAHVGYVALAVPLLALGVIGLVVAVVRDPASGGWRSLTRTGLVSVAIGGVVWMPTFIDTAFGSPRNLVNIVEWFRTADQGLNSVGGGLRVMSSQFGIWPEWATTTRAPGLVGESVYLGSPVAPWVLLAVVVAAVVLWRRNQAGRALVVAAAATFTLGVVAIARTVGIAFQYRLFWTYIPPLIGFVILALAGWRTISTWRGPDVRRPVAVGAGVALLVLTGVNVITATRAGTPHEGDAAAMRALTAPVLDQLDGSDGPVLVSDPLYSGAWYARGLVLQLEKHGIEAVVPPNRTYEAAEHRVYRGGPLAARLVVVDNAVVPVLQQREDLTLIAEWSAVSEQRAADYERDVGAGQADIDAGRIDPAEFKRAVEERHRELHPTGATAYRVAVFLEDQPIGG